MTYYNGKRIVIWGTGREGRAAGDFARVHLAPASITYIDETPSDDASVITTPEGMITALAQADVLIKSPGVSLYHPLIAQARAHGCVVTSLLNLWMGLKPRPKIIAVTGTKGKSTTSALLGHVLTALGHKTAVLGNIGVPVTEAPEGMEYLVIEMSSYQAADFEGACNVAAVTSLYPEHLNWHGTLETYYRDKLNVLSRAAVRIIHPQVADAAQANGIALPDGCKLAAPVDRADVPNAYLGRAHNLANVSIVLAVIDVLGLDKNAAFATMSGFQGLPHRQQELGVRGGLTFVDDSIATTPQAAMAAMDVYAGRPLTLIAGGFDRGIDYMPLVDYVTGHGIGAVVALGESGRRILEGLEASGYSGGMAACNMGEAVAKAVAATPAGGVVLLSPAAPSFGEFKNYIERGQAFAKTAGF